jgi:hypothetical protein
MTDIDPLVGRPTPRRVASPPSRRRRHPATGARIVALGVGASTMFGLVATMGIAQVRAQSTPTSADAVTTVPPAPPTAPLTIVPVPDLAPVAATTPRAGTATAPAAPIVLQARPDVRVVPPAAAAPVAAAPAVATTRGSN